MEEKLIQSKISIVAKRFEDIDIFIVFIDCFKIMERMNDKMR